MSIEPAGEVDVLLFTNATAPDQMGGLERYVRELATALVDTGLNVRLVAKRVDPAHALLERWADGVVVQRTLVPSKRNPAFALLYPLYVAFGVARILRANPRATVHMHFPVPALVMAIVPRRFRRPYLYTFHNPVYRELLDEHQDSYLLPRPVQRLVVAVLRRAERLVVEQANDIVVLSEFTRRELSELSPSAGRRATRVAGGVDTQRFTPGPVPPDEWADAAEHLVVTARRLTPRTGVVELIRAMPDVVAGHPGTRLAVLGDGHLLTEAQRTIDDLGLADSVLLLGRVYDEDLRDWYRRADVAVTPTQELEGFGLSTAEAMACGTMPLVTPVGANPELVIDLPDSCLTAGPSPAELSRGISRRLDAQNGPSREDVRAMTDVWSWPSVADRHGALMARARPTG